MDRNVFDIEKEYVKSIHLNYCEKLDELKSITGIKKIDLREVDSIKNLTVFFMKKADKSDENFLRWMFVIGNHIKGKFRGKWLLIHYLSRDVDRFVPAVSNDNEDIWQVGNFCYNYYYSKRRMHRISFPTFYKLEIERLIWKPKILDLNISYKNFLFIEKKDS